MKTRTSILLSAVIIACLALTHCGNAQTTPVQRPQPDAIEPVFPGMRGTTSLRVDGFPTSDFPESFWEDVARKYYTSSAEDLGIPIPPGGVEQISVRDLLKYMGHEGFDPKNAVVQLSNDLMAANPDILATRYFSPKITDVSKGQNGNVAAFDYGWRKIIRFNARPGSPAALKGISQMHLLVNVFTKTDDNTQGDPFATVDNDFNQVILSGGPDSTAKETLYWFVLRRINRNDGSGGNLGLFLNATFDGRSPDINSSPVKKYYVPAACSHCHGRTKNAAPDEPQPKVYGKLNYVDTDHLYDRLADDFTALPAYLAQTNRSVLLDAGRIKADGGGQESTDELKTAMKVMFTINEEIKTQNFRALQKEIAEDPDIPDTDTPDTDRSAITIAGKEFEASRSYNFGYLAVKKWLELHNPVTAAKPELPKGVFDRVFPKLGANGRQWDASNNNDAKLLPLLNRYCYRCHSSLKWNVMDKQYVFDHFTSIRGKINTGSMPQDRRLEPDIKTDLRTRVQQVHDDTN